MVNILWHFTFTVDVLDSNQRTGRCGRARESWASAGELHFFFKF